MIVFFDTWRGAVYLASGALLGLVIHYVLFRALTILAGRTESPVDDALAGNCRAPSRVILPLLICHIVLPATRFPAGLLTLLREALAIALILSPITWIAKGLYFSLITLILPLAFLDLTFIYGDLFRGEVGLVGMSPLLDLGRVTWNYVSYYYLSLAMMLLYLLVADKIGRSRYGVTLAAINEDEDVARMMGVNVSRNKVFYYVFPSVLTGIVGWFIVHTFRTFAGVTYLPLDYMLKILIIILIGGRAYSYGAVWGAYFVAILEDVIRPLGPVNYVVFPLVLIAAIVFLPRGEGLFGLYHKRHHRDYFPQLKVRRN